MLTISPGQAGPREVLIWQVVDVGLVDRSVGQAVARGELLGSVVYFGSAVIRLEQAME